MLVPTQSSLMWSSTLPGEQIAVIGGAADRGGEAFGDRNDPLLTAFTVHNERPTARIRDEIISMAPRDLAAPHPGLACQPDHE
jgi:hypothetical protein